MKFHWLHQVLFRIPECRSCSAQSPNRPYKVSELSWRRWQCCFVLAAWSLPAVDSKDFLQNRRSVVKLHIFRQIYLTKLVTWQHRLSRELKLATNLPTSKNHLQWTAVQIKPQFMWSTDSETSRALSTHSRRAPSVILDQGCVKQFYWYFAFSQPRAQTSVTVGGGGGGSVGSNRRRCYRRTQAANYRRKNVTRHGLYARWFRGGKILQQKQVSLA